MPISIEYFIIKKYIKTTKKPKESYNFSKLLLLIELIFKRKRFELLKVLKKNSQNLVIKNFY